VVISAAGSGVAIFFRDAIPLIPPPDGLSLPPAGTRRARAARRRAGRSSETDVTAYAYSVSCENTMSSNYRADTRREEVDARARRHSRAHNAATVIQLAQPRLT